MRRCVLPTTSTLLHITLLTASLVCVATASWDGPVDTVEREEKVPVHDASQTVAAQNDHPHATESKISKNTAGGMNRGHVKNSERAAKKCDNGAEQFGASLTLVSIALSFIFHFLIQAPEDVRFT